MFTSIKLQVICKILNTSLRPFNFKLNSDRGDGGGSTRWTSGGALAYTHSYQTLMSKLAQNKGLYSLNYFKTGRVKLTGWVFLNLQKV